MPPPPGAAPPPGPAAVLLPRTPAPGSSRRPLNPSGPWPPGARVDQLASASHAGRNARSQLARVQRIVIGRTDSGHMGSSSGRTGGPGRRPVPTRAEDPATHSRSETRGTLRSTTPGRVDCLPVECLAVPRPSAFTRRSSEAGDRWPVEGRADTPTASMPRTSGEDWRSSDRLIQPGLVPGWVGSRQNVRGGKGHGW
jgi:hypothetical protein